MLKKLILRIRPHLPRVAVLAALLAPGAYVAYDQLAGDDCCYPGSPCCYPGSPCCAKQHK